MNYTLDEYFIKQDLISELQRFYREEGFVPTSDMMHPKYGYPSLAIYRKYFGSWNNALVETGLEINTIRNTLDGTETCIYCGCIKIKGQNWRYDKNGIRYCEKHGHSYKGGLPDYVKGELDINSAKGSGRAGEICVIKTLKIANEHDYNKLSCNYEIDMYNDEYGKIDVKTRLFSYKSNSWCFSFNPKKEADTYICLGFNENRKTIEHVWIVPNEGKIRDLTSFTIMNSSISLRNHKKWEVDNKSYNNVWKTMKLDNCKIMIDKKELKYE